MKTVRRFDKGLFSVDYRKSQDPKANSSGYAALGKSKKGEKVIFSPFLVKVKLLDCFVINHGFLSILYDGFNTVRKA